MKDRRKLERFDIRVPTKIGVIDPKREEEMIELLTSNVCSGGAFFHTKEPLPEGTKVKVDLILPFEKLKELKDKCQQAHVKVSGIVMRAASTGMAICFNSDYQIHPCGVGQDGVA
jgi:hypothetical protein